MSGGRVLVMGSSNTDLVCVVDHLPAPGETVPSHEYHVAGGGKGANQAVAAARAGAQVTFAGAVGSDDFGRERLLDLKNDGINTSAVDILEGVASGLAFIFVDDSGENQIVTYGGANDRLTHEHVTRVARLAQPNFLLLTLESPPACIDALLSIASTSNSTVALNAAPYKTIARDYFDRIDILIVNEIEASQLCNSVVAFESAADSAVALRESGPKVVVITLGADGAVVADQRGTIRFPALPIDAVDTTGAGDAFCGAMIAAMSNGADARNAVQKAVIAGGLAATRKGAQPSLPTLEEIEHAHKELGLTSI